MQSTEKDIDNYNNQLRERPALSSGKRLQFPQKQLWNPDQDLSDQDLSLTRASVNPSNIVSVKIRHERNSHTPPPAISRQSHAPCPENTSLPQILGNKMPTKLQSSRLPSGEMPFDMARQPETRPISQEQLVTELKGIYVGLVMVEGKCIQVDIKQATLAQAKESQPKLNNEQYQALITLHRTLLHEHHDFFLASQHPSATPALRRLAPKYTMPARVWRHCIYSFLELQRHRLPASLHYMVAFIYLAYSMMTLLLETVPAFEDYRIECPSDLGRYRMTVKDDDIRDREAWTGIARHWYSKASDKAPTVGHLYHHLAILARPNALKQLLYYTKSLYGLAHRIDSTAQFIESSFLGLLKKKTIQFMILLSQIFKSFQVTMASPIPAITESLSTSNSEGFINYFAGQWHQLKDHISGPMVENTGYACLLTGMYYGLTRCDEGLWKGTNLLEIATIATASYSYFLGNEEWLSDPQVVMVASLNIRLGVKILQQKLSEFPKTWMPTVFFIESASFGSAGMLAKYMPAPGGRYKNPWVQAAMLIPLTNMFFTAFWIIFIRNPGVAKYLEEAALFAAIVECFQRRLPAILALALILVLLAKV